MGAAPATRPRDIKKLWDNINANELQDAANQRNINADTKLRVVFGKPLETMLGRAPSWNGHPFT